jgi:hypothetical protein
MGDFWENVATVLYRDGATIKSLINHDTEAVCLVLARSHEAADENYVITKQQAGEIIYVLSKALMMFNEDKEVDYE